MSEQQNPGAPQSPQVSRKMMWAYVVWTTLFTIGMFAVFVIALF